MKSRSTVDFPLPAAPVTQMCGRQERAPQTGARTIQPRSRLAETGDSQEKRSEILASAVAASSERGVSDGPSSDSLFS